jgi:preprotein translocase subunit Sss1
MGNGEAEKGPYTLSSFYNSKDVGKNSTKICKLCLAPDWDSYKEDCYAKDTTADWVLLNKFSQTKSNEILKKLQKPDEVGSNETYALVFISDTDITSGSVYPRPHVISIASTERVGLFK